MEVFCLLLFISKPRKQKPVTSVAAFVVCISPLLFPHTQGHSLVVETSAGACRSRAMNSARSQTVFNSSRLTNDIVAHVRVWASLMWANGANIYRRFRTKPYIVPAVGGYLMLMVLCAVINIFAPEFASRNLPVMAEDSTFIANHGARWRQPSPGQCVARGLMEGRFDDPSVARVKEAYDCGCRLPDVYERHETPTVCAIVQSFNHRLNVPKIALALVDNPSIDEVIICEDGSSDDSLEAWHTHLRGMKHFIVVSNNLHETRCYNRAMRMTSADYFVLLQDDDLPPFIDSSASDSSGGSRSAQEAKNGEHSDINWVDEALQLFRGDLSLGILTGFIGQIWDEQDLGFEFGEQQSEHGGMRKGTTRRIPFLSRQTRRPFMYVECGWIAPLVVRAEVLRRVGGLDIDLFRQGEPGVWQDCVFSYAAWSAGWRVGVYDAKFQRGVGGHGSTSTEAKAKMREVVWKRAKDVADSRYERDFTRGVVLKLNNLTLDLRYREMQ